MKRKELYNIKKLYKGFKNAVGIKDEMIAKMLWDNMLCYKDDALNFSEHFENWLRNSEMVKKYVNL